MSFFNNKRIEQRLCNTEDSKKELEKEDITDKARYIISHKIDCLSEINL